MIFNVFWLSHSRATVFSLSNNHASPSITPIRQVPFILRSKTPPSISGARQRRSPSAAGTYLFYCVRKLPFLLRWKTPFLLSPKTPRLPFLLRAKTIRFSCSHSFHMPPAKILSLPPRGLRFMQQFAFEILPPVVRVGFRILAPPTRRKP